MDSVSRQRWTPPSRSEDLTDNHGGHRREQRDAESGEGILPLSDGHAGDHTGAEAGDRQLGGQFSARLGIGAGEHGGEE